MKTLSVAFVVLAVTSSAFAYWPGNGDCPKNCPKGTCANKLQENGQTVCRCVDPCKDKECAADETCELVKVQCFRAPCLPIATCVPRSPRCTGGQVWSECGSACTPTCDTQGLACIMMCTPARCQCPSDRPLLENGICITAEQCPIDPCSTVRCASGLVCEVTSSGGATCVPRCTGGQVWSQCGSACTPTCDTQDMACIMMCTPARCQCPSDRPLLENGICISAEQCPIDPCSTVRCASGLVCVVTSSGGATCVPRCTGGQEWVECGSACTPTCDTQDLGCIEVCKDARCQCPSDRPLLDDGICISAKQCVDDACKEMECAADEVCELRDVQCESAPCPPIATCVPRTPRCTGGQVWSECGSACTPTCDTQGLACILMCTDARCQCPSDRPLLENGICISADQCPTEDPCKEMECAADETCELRKVVCVRAPCPPIATCVPRCSGGQVWTDCGSACTPTCDKQVMACILMCKARCQCPSDRPLLDNGICISAKQCPTEDPCKDKECAADETCELRKVICVRAPCPPIATCVPRCTGGQVWTDCGSPCTPTCDKQFMACILMCKARCQCPSDRPLLDNGICISAKQCPIDPCKEMECASNETCQLKNVICVRAPCPPIATCVPRCTGGQVWEAECGRSCTPTCATRNDPCTAVCAPPRCQCPSDRVILDNGSCISADQCFGGPNPDSCIAMLCGPGFVCEVTEVKCITAPCPSIASCVPVKG